jgi:hypothetical protein
MRKIIVPAAMAVIAATAAVRCCAVAPRVPAASSASQHDLHSVLGDLQPLRSTARAPVNRRSGSDSCCCVHVDASPGKAVKYGKGTILPVDGHMPHAAAGLGTGSASRRRERACRRRRRRRPEYEGGESPHSGPTQMGRDQNSAGRYPLISRPMQISTGVGVVQAILSSSLEFLNTRWIGAGRRASRPRNAATPPRIIISLARRDAPRKERCALRSAAAGALAATENGRPFPYLSSIVCRLISRNPAAAARYSRARAAGGSSRRSAGAILPECAARAERLSRPAP